ncbi:zeaxanthin epoxidase, chloroplastic-like [Dorcoceras hygrometricum]|uniref:Zeaxanthin epoxidase, chloroplastic-like n=1 Tax=Dorcoceras hygrometricum TaxID=472368 RepID=A0A2Z7B0K7_9LAMI|nr:zeaxanthin epoxidase, chloroplastic-like [Dorcoceras hygrometricum]
MVYVDATRIHGPAHIIEGSMYAEKLSTPLTIVVSRLELPLTLAHIIGDVKGTVLHDSTLMGHLDTWGSCEKLSTPLTIVVSWLELPLTLAHIIGDVTLTVLHDSTLMGNLDT